MCLEIEHKLQYVFMGACLQEIFFVPYLTQICYYCTLAENELAGMAISEIALADAEGDLIAIQNCASKGKDNDWEITFKINDMM